MKHILKIIIVILALGCTKEIDFADDFDFKVLGINNDLIFIGTQKQIQIDMENVNAQKDHQYMIYFETIEGYLDVIYNGETWIAKKQYPYNPLQNKFSVRPKTTGTIKFKLVVSSGATIKEDIFQIYCTDSDFEFNFNASASNSSPTLAEPVTIVLNLEKVGLSEDSFTLKFENDKTGFLLKQNDTLETAKPISIKTGENILIYHPRQGERHLLTFEVTNSKEMTKQVIIPLDIQTPVFELTLPYNPMNNIREAVAHGFSLVFSKFYPYLNHQVKFTPKYSSSITDSSNKAIPNNTFVELEIPKDGVCWFKYTPLQSNSLQDQVTITIKDQSQNIQEFIMIVNIVAKPKITNVKVFQTTSNGKVRTEYDIANVIVENAGVGAYLEEYQFQILNKTTSNWDTFNLKTNVILDDYQISYLQNYKYWQQPYRARIKDNYGTWSDYWEGTF